MKDITAQWKHLCHFSTKSWEALWEALWEGEGQKPRQYEGEWTGVHSMESSGVVPKFVKPYHWDQREFKNYILATALVSCKTCLPFNTTGCFILSFNRTVIRFSSSDCDSYSCVLPYTGKWRKFEKLNISALTGADKVTPSVSKANVSFMRLFKWMILFFY